MKKEALIAIVLGLIFGSIFGVFLINKNKEFNLEKNKALVPTSIITQKNQRQNAINYLPLEIKEPNDYFITSENNIDIVGKASNQSLIVIQSPIKDIIYKNEKEDFKINIPLALGENVIKIVDYPKDKTFDSQEKTLRVYYLKIDL
ncbi:MAG: hypothetical protein Fur009_2670 [Candidatus Microgenomates bacterium]